MLSKLAPAVRPDHEEQEEGTRIFWEKRESWRKTEAGWEINEEKVFFNRFFDYMKKKASHQEWIEHEIQWIYASILKEQTNTGCKPLQVKYFLCRRHSLEKYDNVPRKMFFIRRRKQKRYYELTIGDSQVLPACQFRTWQRTRLPCKHFFAVFRHFPDWQWDNLSLAYRNGPRLTLDEAIIYTPGFDDVKPEVSAGSNKTNSQENVACCIGPEKEEPYSTPNKEHCKEKPAQLEKKGGDAGTCWQSWKI